MTIHKSQGQSLKKVAVWLQESCFGHGQLYVAASRVGNPDDIKFYIKTIEGQPDFATRNIVYKELLQSKLPSLFRSSLANCFAGKVESYSTCLQ